MIAIIDYDAGNLKSVENALRYLGESAIISRNKKDILTADKVILPGVGSFGEAMNKLNKYDLVDTINEVCTMNKPFLGICLGLQLLFEQSEEAPNIKGLGILEGEILRIPSKEGIKIPHIGWNRLDNHEDSTLFKGLGEAPYVYFVHSYYLKAKNKDEVAATTTYSDLIHASIEKNNIFACQFHPEKSGDIGLEILKNYSKL